MFFDNLTIHHNRGPILQEDHYYPTGLVMAGISDQAILKPDSRYKYQGKELDADLALDLYDFEARNYDPQLGRFNQIDPASQFASGYLGIGNNWVNGQDPDGEWFGIDDAIAMFVGGTMNLLNAAFNGKVTSFSAGLKYFGAGAVGAEVGLYLGPGTGFAVGGSLNVWADYSEGHLNGQNVGMTILNTGFSFLSGGSSAAEGAVAGLAKKAEIEFGREWTHAQTVAAQELQPLSGQVQPSTLSTEANVPKTMDGPPESSMLGTPEGQSYFENPGGGTEPTLNRSVEAPISNEGGHSVYQGVDASGNVRYIGRTGREPGMRFTEHANSISTGKEELFYSPIEGATNLSKMESRIWGQNLINKYGLQKNGGLLLNRINSIAPKYWWMYGVKSW